jgi:hypothetical protein
VAEQFARVALEEFVAGGMGADVHAQPVSVEHAKAEQGQSWWQSRREGDRARVIAHPAESGHAHEPCAGQRCEVAPVAGVEREVAESMNALVSPSLP